VNAGLLSVERQGRGRYFRLAGTSVAEALEALARISRPEPIRSLRQGTRAHALRRARTCYNHLAGRLGVALMSACWTRDSSSAATDTTASNVPMPPGCRLRAVTWPTD
jgi:hypothetical protein